MVGKTGFFRGAAPQSSFNPSKKRTLVDLGGAGDCGFRAIAAGLIDNIINFPNQKSHIVERLKTLPQNTFSRTLLNDRPGQAAEQMKDFMQQPYRSDFLSELANALRQLAVAEVSRNKKKYRGVFVAQHEGTAPFSMRRSTTWIDESMIAALSAALEVPICINFVDRQRDIALPIPHGEEFAKSKADWVTIQLKNSHYRVEVLHPDLFIGMNRSHLKVIRSEPLPESVIDNPILPEILQQIEESDRQILNEFEKTRNRLEIMVKAGEISKDELMNLYIKGLGTSDYLEGRVKYIGLEHGNQDFFEALEQAYGGVGSSNAIEKGSEDAVTAELIHALARAISIGQMDSTLVDDENLGARAYR